MELLCLYSEMRAFIRRLHALTTSGDLLGRAADCAAGIVHWSYGMDRIALANISSGLSGWWIVFQYPASTQIALKNHHNIWWLKVDSHPVP